MYLKNYGSRVWFYDVIAVTGTRIVKNKFPVNDINLQTIATDMVELSHLEEFLFYTKGIIWHINQEMNCISIKL